ncbi:MAG: hypothetical protein ACRD16_15455 [Thermoanaerobaculia bacterium]
MPEATERELLRALAGMDVSPERVRELLSDRDARRLHVVRRVLAAHPKTPRVDALVLVPTLYWRDLAWISSEARAHPAIRRAADQEILRRAPGLALAERCAVAELAGRGVIAALRRDGDAAVLRSLLRNRLTVESDAVFIASMSRDPPFLATLPLAPVWGARIAVRAAVARNAFTPAAVAVELFPSIPIGDLREICHEAARPASVRLRARLALAERVEDGLGLL